MPELPEIETIKLQLQKHLIGLVVEKLERKHVKSVMGDVELIKGKEVKEIDRIGKMLVIKFEGDIVVAIHLKMSGQLILVKSEIRNSKFETNSKDRNLKKSIKENRIAGGHPTRDWVGELPSKHTRAIFYFKSGDVLYFNDQRIFGWVKILDSKTVRQLRYVRQIGKEPWDMTDGEFFKITTGRKRPIKLVIMDQETLSGVGNIYANDALWEAGIDPIKKAKTLRQEDCKTLRQAIIKVLREGIKYGGATAADAKYINLEGMGGHYQDHFRVYDREGQKCLRNDGGIIKKVKLGGRGTYFCPACQR